MQYHNNRTIFEVEDFVSLNWNEEMEVLDAEELREIAAFHAGFNMEIMRRSDEVVFQTPRGRTIGIKCRVNMASSLDS